MRTFNEIMGVGNADLKGLIMEKLPDSPIVTAKKKLYVPERKLILMDQLTEQEKNDLWDSARNADMEYVPGETYTVTLDGFIISDNIECTSYEDINTGYSYSDHDPVYLKFRLK